MTENKLKIERTKLIIAIIGLILALLASVGNGVYQSIEIKNNLDEIIKLHKEKTEIISTASTAQETVVKDMKLEEEIFQTTIDSLTAIIIGNKKLTNDEIEKLEKEIKKLEDKKRSTAKKIKKYRAEIKKLKEELKIHDNSPSSRVKITCDSLPILKKEIKDLNDKYFLLSIRDSIELDTEKLSVIFKNKKDVEIKFSMIYENRIIKKWLNKYKTDKLHFVTRAWSYDKKGIKTTIDNRIAIKKINNPEVKKLLNPNEVKHLIVFSNDKKPFGVFLNEKYVYFNIKIISEEKGCELGKINLYGQIKKRKLVLPLL